MKKIILAIFTLVVSLSVMTNVEAAANSILLDYAKQTHTIAGKSVSLSGSDYVKVVRFLNENNVSDSEANQIITKLNEAISIMNNAGVSDITKLSKTKKTEVFNKAKEAASIVGVSLSYNNSSKTISAYDKNGVKIDAVSVNPYLKQTGASNTLLISVAGVSIIGIVAITLGRKKNA